uniref:Uncharacterized protein n=1 Tax=Arundo donax TaxID=35708 RepID=A0A0A8ZK71_ARUDO
MPNQRLAPARLCLGRQTNKKHYHNVLLRRWGQNLFSVHPFVSLNQGFQ